MAFPIDMGNILRVSLSGINAITDTNPDNYSVYVSEDTDNVLLKEKERGTFTQGAGTKTIAHNLGYVPFFVVYVDDQVSPYLRNGWKLVASQNNAFVVNSFYAEADSTNLYITNNTGTDSDFFYLIFYDNQVGSSPVSITPSNARITASRDTENALTSNDPNDFIFHSDLNTLKIIKRVNVTYTYGAAGETNYYHGVVSSNPLMCISFIRFPDGYTALMSGENIVYSLDGNFFVQDFRSDTSQCKHYTERTGGSGANIKESAFFFDPALTGNNGITITPSDHLMRITKDGYNALTDTDINHYSFLSGYPTLKYDISGSQNITIVGDGTIKISTITISHGLGYVPFFIVYVDDFVFNPNSRYSLVPYKNDTFTKIRRAEAYADANNIYLVMTNRSTDTYTARFYYKVYKNSLGF